VTCGASRDRAAAEGRCHYVAFRGFFPSMAKTTTKYRATAVLLEDWSETTVVSCCEIGGVTEHNCGRRWERRFSRGDRRHLVAPEGTACRRRASHENRRASAVFTN